MSKLHDLQYELVNHRPYSPDLVSNEYYLFKNLKKWLGGKRLASNSEVIDSVNSYFEVFDKSYYLEEIKQLEIYLTKAQIFH